MRKILTIAATALLLSLSACNSTGGFASFSSTATPAQKIDWAETVKRGCNGTKVAIAAVDAIYTGDPKIFGNDANYKVYVSVKKTLLDTCGTTPPTDLQSAAANLLLAATDAGQLVSTLKEQGVIK